jgi:imidazolonepropionase-like amidohydrolase
VETKIVVLTNAVLFDGTRYSPHTRHTVEIVGNRIVGVFEDRVERGERAQVIDLGGAFLMPGLIDAHTHVNIPTFDIAGLSNWPPSLVSLHARRILDNLLQQGFTSIRDAAGADIGLVKALEAGLIEGPRLFIAGKALSQTGGHGDMRERIPVACLCHGAVSVTEIVDGEQEVRRAVREQFRLGANHVKLMLSGGVLSPVDPIWMDQFSDGEIAVAVEEAGRWGSYVMAHAHTAAAAQRCARLGVRSIEHGTMIDGPTAELLAATDVVVVPTLAILEGMQKNSAKLPAGMAEKLQRVAETAYAAVEHCRAAGVKTGMGSDLLGPLHGGESREIVLRAGVAPTLDVLTSATRINGRLIQPDGNLGVIQRGALADLIVMEKNPFDDICVFDDASRNVSFVMQDGRIRKDTQKRCPESLEAA